MKNQREQRSTMHKHCDFNSVILAVRPATVDKFRMTEDDYSLKLKEIRALKKFEEIFRKDILQKQFSIPNHSRNSNDFAQKKQRQSPHQLNNRLKGMFFLRRKAQLQNKYNYECTSDQTSEDQSAKHTIQGKTVSPSKPKKKKQTKQRRKQSQNKPYNFVNSGKLITNNIISKRPHSQLDPDVQTQKLFNNRIFYNAILGANNVKLLSNRPSNFTYFSVYVQQGNNSQLIKSAVRKRSGWKVVQIPSVANMIWSQFYRKALDLKIKHRNKQLAKINDESTQHKDNLVNLPGLIENSLLKKRLIQKQLERNPNLLPLEQYNKQMQKICPKHQHLHRKPVLQISPSLNLYFYNHIPNHHLISDKTNLFRNMKKLYENKGLNIFNVMPYSLDICQPCVQNDLKIKINNLADCDGYWIVKPGQNSNRGRGITVCKGLQSVAKEINSRFSKKEDEEFQQQEKSNSKQDKSSSKPKKQQRQKTTIILQKYIEPLLYFKRKFDIRMYLLVTVVNQKIRGYVYEEGYVRTSSKLFTMQTFNKFVHLTNDAIQARSSDYGKFQQGNKVSWKRFQKWLQEEGHRRFWTEFKNDYKSICKNILQSVKDSFKKVSNKHYKHYSEHLLSHQTKSACLYDDNSTQKVSQFNESTFHPLTSSKSSMNEKQKFYFQVFGLDFLIDNTPKTWLIQVNTNPAITTDCSRVVNSIIPQMIDNAFTIAVQPYLKNSSHRQFDTVKFQNNFQVIFDDQWQQ